MLSGKEIESKAEEQKVEQNLEQKVERKINLIKSKKYGKDDSLQSYIESSSNPPS